MLLRAEHQAGNHAATGPIQLLAGLTVTAEWEQLPDFDSITSGQDIEVPLTFVDAAGVEPVTGSITIRVSPKKKR